MMRSARSVIWFCMAIICAGSASAQKVTVTARVALEDGDAHGKDRNAENVVIWLTPPEGTTPAPRPAPGHFRLTQRNKNFEPHLLAIPAGSLVEFPNRDPFFHNVFSLFEGKRFDLGLYEAGTTREVHFDKPGISYIFCNIHAEMSAVVVALDTPYYGVSNRRGEIVIPDVPSGPYTAQAWYESGMPESLKRLSRKVNISENDSTLGVLHLKAGNIIAAHKNKYGRDYDPPPRNDPAYDHP
jgi:plastocyanin